MPEENSLKLQDSDMLTFLEFHRGLPTNNEYTYKYKKFRSTFTTHIQNGALSKSLRETNPPVIVLSDSWFDGINCELLRDGVEQKGKIRVVLEFIPDEVKVTDQPLIDGRSPLDDIRQINL